MKYTTDRMQAIHSAFNTPQTATQPRTAPNDTRTVSEGIRDEISAYVRSGAVDAAECCALAMEQVARRFGLTFRQCERLFVELA